MKKILLVTFFIFMSFGLVYSQEFIMANQGSVEWNAVTTLNNGDPIPVESTIKYGIYLKDQNDLITKIDETENLLYTYTFFVEGKFVTGVSAIRYIGTEVINESLINWADVNGASTPNPFVFMYYEKLSIPQNQRPTTTP